MSKVITLQPDDGLINTHIRCVNHTVQRLKNAIFKYFLDPCEYLSNWNVKHFIPPEGPLQV